MPDLTAPTLLSSSTSNSTIVLTFTEAMAAGTGFITISDGATQTYMGKDGTFRTRLINATDTRTVAVADTSQVTISGDTVTITLATDLKASKNYSVQMSKAVLLDTAGNAYAGLSDTSQLTFTTAAVATPSAVVGSTFTMTDTGSSTSDFITSSAAQTVAGTFTGTLAAGDSVMVSLDGGGTWNPATVNAADSTWNINGTLTGSSTIMARVVNAEGHYSAPARHTYTFDTTAPAEATITLSDSYLMAGETSTVTVAFDEAVTGLELSDFTVDGGTLSSLASSADGKTWTATLTPTHGVAATTGSVTLKTGSIADVAGNTGLAADTIKAFNYSTVPNAPSAVVSAVSMTDSGFSSSDFITNSTAQTITATYTGTLAADEYIEVSLNNGTTWSHATAGSGNQWTLSSATISASNTLMARVTNGYTYSNPLEQAYTLDQSAPTATITLADSTLGVGDTSLVTFTFSEAVKEFANADITIANGTLSTVSTSDNGVTWTATYTPTASVADATNVISVNLAGLNDVAGNLGSGTASSANYAVDTVRPTVSSITLSDSALTAGETSTVTIVFSEAVTGFGTADLTAGSGAISSLASADNITWTATLTPTESVTDSSNVVALDLSGVADAAGNSGSGSSSSSNYTVSTVRPDVSSITVSDTALTAGETSTVTFVFSEAVTGFAAADVTVANGTLSTPVTTDNITWTATLTPSASVDDSTNVITVDKTGVTNSAGNAGTGATSSSNYTVATVRPEATITVSDTALKIGDTATVTITFSEAVTGLEADDFSVANGTLSTPATTDNITWTATLTPASGIEDATNVITLNNTGVKDSNNNTGSGTTSSSNYTVDTTAPTVTSMSLSDSTLTTSQTATFTIEFSEAVTASTFTSSDVTVTGGTLGAFTSDDNITWTATLTPTATGSGSGSIQLAAASVTDTAGNSGPAAAHSTSFTYANAPTVTVASVAMTDSGTSGDFITNATSQTISGTLSAALGSGEFVEVSLNNGASWTTVTSVEGTSWTLSGQTISASNTLKVRVSNSGATGTEYSQAYTLDQSAPTAAITLSSSELITGESTTVTITFDQKVTGLTDGDLKYTGTLGALTSNADGTVWTATLTPTASGTGEVRLNASSVTDVAGNAGPSSEASASYTYNAAPTATIASASITDTGTSGDFITSSTSQQISGTLSAALGRGQYVEVSLNGGDTWTAATINAATPTTWTLSGQTISSSGTLKVRATNGSSTSETYSHSYTLDQAAPTLSSISLSDSSLVSNQTATVTVVFSEAVSGLSKDDFTISGGTLGTFTSADNITWSGTLTPTASGSIALKASSVSDTAGNSGPAAASTSQEFSFTVDNTGPSATLTLSDSTLTSGQTATLTVTFSEAVTDTPASADFTLSGGTLGTFTSADGGTTWTTTLTPTASSYGEGYVSLTANTITDPSNNTGPSSAASLAFNFDTQSLALSSTITLSDDSGTSGSDMITNVAAQTISGSFSGGAIYSTMGAKIEVSTDNGETYSSATVDNTTHTWSISKTLSGSSYIKVRLTDASGATETVSHSYTLDTTAPTLTSSTPSSSATGIGISTSSITLGFSEALVDSAHNGFKVSNGSDIREITGEMASGNTLSYNASTHTVTLSLSGSLQYGSNYTVSVYNQALYDTAGNSLALDTSLLTFTTESHSIPSAVTLSLTETTYASHTGTDSDHITSNDALTISGISSAYLRYKLTSTDSWLTLAAPVNATSYTINLGAGTFTAGDIQVQQFDDVGYESSSAVLSHSWTVDQTAPTAYATSTTLPSFFGLGTGTALTSLTGSLSAALGSNEYVEYTNDDGATWSTATTASTAWTIASVGVAYGGAIGLRVTDAAGNTSSNGSLSGYTLYVGDGYGGTFTATGSKVLYAMDGNDTITVSGSSNVINGGSGSDTITVSGSSNVINGDAGSDSITLSALNNTVDGGAGADTITISASLSSLSGSVSGGSADESSDILSLTAGSQTLTLASLTSNIAHFEKIQLASNDVLTITPAAAADMSDLGTLYILGDATNTLHLSGAWTAANSISLYSAYYNEASSITVYFSSTMTLSLVAPAETIASVSFSADTGSSASDFITNTASQTISGTLSAALSSGEYVEVSLDSGSSWDVATTSGTSWTLSGKTLSSSNTLIARVSNGAATGTAYSQAYTLDQTSPGASVSTSTTFDSTGSSAALTITGSLTGSWSTGEFVEYSTNNGSTWQTATSTTSSGFAISSLTGASGGILGLRVSDTAGNTDSSVLEHTLYIGDGNGATFTTSNDMWVFSGGGADNGTISGSGSQIYTYGGADTLAISGSSNFVSTGDGDDIISVTGSYNSISAGDGADTITFTGTLSGSLYGGSDSSSDTLVLSTGSQALNLTSMTSYAHQFEVVQLGSNSALTLSAYAADAMSDTTTFKIVGDATNTVWVNYGEWTSTTTELVGVKAYTNATYGMTLYVSTAVTVSTMAS